MNNWREINRTEEEKSVGKRERYECSTFFRWKREHWWSLNTHLLHLQTEYSASNPSVEIWVLSLTRNLTLIDRWNQSFSRPRCNLVTSQKLDLFVSTKNPIKTVMQAFITSFFNTITPRFLLTHYDPRVIITPILPSLHFRHFWMDFDRFGLWLAPDYITDLPTTYEPECILRSSGRSLLVIPWSRLKN